MAQVSVNITDLEVTGIHQAYEECVKDAEVSSSIRKTGFELNLNFI